MEKFYSFPRWYRVFAFRIELQGIEVVYSNVNNGIFRVFAKFIFDFAICLDCGHLTYTVHDRRFQSYKHLPIWGMATLIVLEKKRYVCNCAPKRSFDEDFAFIKKYARYTISYEKYIFTLTHKNTIKNVSKIIGSSEGTCQRIYNYISYDKECTFVYTACL